MLFSAILRLRLAARQLGVRVALIAVLSIAAVFAAKLLGRFIPIGFSEVIGADAVDRLLTIIANSMLAVTTFSLSVMVSVHRSVSSQWTPRAHRMHLQDTRTQTVLATFVGAYIYALLSIILLETPFFGEKEIVVLFLTTLLVLVLIVVTILRWIIHLQTFGSLTQTAQRIVEVADKALMERRLRPALGGNALIDPALIPSQATAVHAKMSGYVLRILEKSLNDAATACDGTVWVMPQVGGYLNKGDVIAFYTGGDLEKAIHSYIDIGMDRDVEQDPEFGLLMLAEVGIKALSPGINDSGTAIDMLDRLTLILEKEAVPTSCTLDRIWIRPLEMGQVMYLPFDLIARHGATTIEVQISLLARLKHLAQHSDPTIREAAKQLAQEAYSRAANALPTEIERERLHAPDWI